ncbi:hypothetical protein BJ875DRAFT_509977 [Amylocarpus encephaloides]|uniref:2EXR domain-containing protein n=1 Tax=Amylocarpus encephaloides TaxID=45428 RepID=A0A9P8C545_9HELO|nr:hypothetical protein BJ875DRAFT_509977 [Amylocarpus encephaloides]
MDARAKGSKELVDDDRGAIMYQSLQRPDESTGCMQAPSLGALDSSASNKVNKILSGAGVIGGSYFLSSDGISQDDLEASTPLDENTATSVSPPGIFTNGGTNFSSLPPEIRKLIWRLPGAAGRFILIDQVHPTQKKEGKIGKKYWKPVCPDRVLTVLHINSESRTEALKRYTLLQSVTPGYSTVYVNCSQDTILLVPDLERHAELYILGIPDNAQEQFRIRHISFDKPIWYGRDDLEGVINKTPGFKNVQAIKIGLEWKRESVENQLSDAGSDSPNGDPWDDLDTFVHSPPRGVNEEEDPTIPPSGPSYWIG